MKSTFFKVPLECVRGSVLGLHDSVEITGPTLRASNGVWWAETTLQEPIPGHAVLPYSKLRSIFKALDDDDKISIEIDGATCRVKTEFAAWRLNLLNIPIEPLPEFTPISTIVASGCALLDAHKRLKHLVHTELSKPGLLWAWTNEKKELVIGDGLRLGGCHIGTEGLELPTLVLMEIWHILGVRQSENVTFQIGEKCIRAKMRDTYFQFTIPSGPRFETDWYNQVKNALNEDPQIIRLSRSELLHAINHVKVTAADSTVKAGSANGHLILTAIDAQRDKSGSRIEADGNLREPIILNVDHLASAVEALSDEYMILKVCKTVVEVSDKKGWEIISRR